MQIDKMTEQNIKMVVITFELSTKDNLFLSSVKQQETEITLKTKGLTVHSMKYYYALRL